ncbi:MAG: CDP-archaeol synthase [Clostridia bacterium]|nr:CDP-archaeol synthase [Clostridia bacterium]
MKKRLISSVFIVAFTLAFVLLKQVHALFFDAFALLISYVSLREIIKAQGERAVEKSTQIALYLVPAAQFSIYFFASGYLALVLHIALAAVLFIYLLSQDMSVYAKDRRLGTTEPNAEVLNQHLFDRTKRGMMIFAYPLLPISFLFALNHLPYEVGYMGIILTIVIAMLTDTCAYLFGMGFGHRKLIPEVSPKKTIEGCIGGFVGGLIGVVICYLVFKFAGWFSVLETVSSGVSICAFLILGVVGSYINQLGDLVASAYKRKFNIKDFSNIFPGHGGFMDRVDGQMFVAIVVYVGLALLFVV